MTTKQPNILFLFPDQHRFDWVGANKALGLRTPHLDALMARGMTFTNCYTPAPVCSPARACLATGRGYERCQVVHNGHNTPTDVPSYYRLLRESGYDVCGVGKFDLHKADSDWGLDGQNMLPEYGFSSGCDNEGKGDAISSFKRNDNQAKGPYMHYLSQRGLVDQHVAMYDNAVDKKSNINFSAITDLPDEAYCDNWIADNGKRFLRGFAADAPWHLVLNFTGPHDPYDVTQDMADAWGQATFPDPTMNTDADPEQVRRRRRYYAAMIENIDRHLGDLLAIVEERGELENTIVVFSSDHGEMLGDHNRWAKGVWHEGSSHVPLVIAGPGVQQGVVSDTLTSIHDLAATYVDVAGAGTIADDGHPTDAKSLRPVLVGDQSIHRDLVWSGLDNNVKPNQGWRMVRDARYKLVRNWTGPFLGEPHDGSDLLFDLQEDPWEAKNISADQPEKAQALRAELDAAYTGHIERSQG